ncbi:hypothetical protein J4U01_gp087 [Mycobacterium phage Kumao]|uniref:Uncharacterized protein n=1 Tax=Mycobacterium phage Kumao TaxID=2041344 RepID=A0A2D1GQ56_9CAUD|nr:hypothetical protein J4U01_gp087 [Mycobacterium phage Kumao]ATN94071.1 hypothetical protein SEA_KUMAO_109 [Mycobacterium phage Kumao]
MFWEGAQVHVSDASPKGWVGTVVQAKPGALTVRKPNGGVTLVRPHLRTVTLITR